MSERREEDTGKRDREGECSDQLLTSSRSATNRRGAAGGREGA